MASQTVTKLTDHGDYPAILLVLQYEFGMAVNIGQPAQPGSHFPERGIQCAPTGRRSGRNPCSLGSGLVIFAILSLISSLRSGLRSLQVFGSLAFLTILLAAITGLLFTMSGFQKRRDSHGMATNFLLSFTFYFLELYFLKPPTKLNSVFA